MGKKVLRIIFLHSLLWIISLIPGLIYFTMVAFLWSTRLETINEMNAPSFETYILLLAGYLTGFYCIRRFFSATKGEMWIVAGGTGLFLIVTLPLMQDYKATAFSLLCLSFSPYLIEKWKP